MVRARVKKKVSFFTILDFFFQNFEMKNLNLNPEFNLRYSVLSTNTNRFTTKT